MPISLPHEVSEHAASATRAAAAGTARRRVLADRFAKLAVRAGGLGVIASILGILAFLLAQVAPLGFPARIEPGRSTATAGAAARALMVDDHRAHVAALGDDGVLRVIRLEDGALVAQRDLRPPPRPGAAEPPRIVSVARSSGDARVAAATSDGRVVTASVSFTDSFEDGTRRITARICEATAFDLDPAAGPIGAFAVRSEEGRTTAAAVLASGAVATLVRETKLNEFSGERSEREEQRLLVSPAPATVLLLDRAQRDLYAGTADGRLLRWDLAGDSDAPLQQAQAGSAAVTALDVLVGDHAVVVGDEDGTLSVFAPTPSADGAPARLARIHALEPMASAVALLATSRRDREILAQSRAGDLRLYYSTSERTLWSGPTPLPGATALAFSPRGDGAVFAGPGGLVEAKVDSRHPEISLRALFGSIWYEGYPAPAKVWQSSSGTDAFEPKLSLTPLVIGTLKGTFYSLVLALPLAVLGAMYTSQFMHPRIQRIVKPTVEIMASLPSVVLGFLAALWLAPRIEREFPAMVLSFLAIPVLAVAAGASFALLPKALRGRLPAGLEIVWFALVIGAGVALCLQSGGRIESSFFGGSFPMWLASATGLQYDQRNAIVVGIAMGFAVVPIIFAISEDAFANVPRSLTAGSLALGATRWQTVTRVVLPTASPGIFSATMIGFGRAVGETMIVLMATGNTPILDWSPFNGFRTLSANIAVEIPEAPVGGTLYRTLFLAALLLFVLTFVVNTAAEVVRHRLRQRYARL